MTAAQPWNTPPLVVGRPVASITCRQADVLAGLCHGHSNAEIAKRLNVSVQTVKEHLKRLYLALGARGRSHAVALAASGQIVLHVRNDEAPRWAA